MKVDEFSVSLPAGYHLEKKHKTGKCNVHDDYAGLDPKWLDLLEAAALTLHQ